MIGRSTLCLIMVFSLVFATGCSKDETKSDGFPDAVNDRLILKQAPDDTTSGEVRHVVFANDGITPLRETVTLPDGSQKEIFFKPDFKIWRTIEYHAPVGSKRIKREIVYAADGIGYLSHSIFREDGTREQNGQRLGDGSYEFINYFADGEHVSMRRVEKDRSTAHEDSYDESGKLVKSTDFSKKGMYDSVETTYFDADGKPLYIKSKTDSYSDKTIVFYPGTDKRYLEFELRDTGGQIRHYSFNGELIREGDFGPSKIRVTYYTPIKSGNNTAYVQYFDRTDKDLGVDSTEWNFELDAVEDRDYFEPPQGSDKTQLSRLVEFDPGQNRPSHAIIKESWSYSKAKTTLYLNRNGRVIKQEVVTEDEHYKEHSTVQSFDPAVRLERPFDWNRTVFVPFEIPSYVQFPKINVRPIPAPR